MGSIKMRPLERIARNFAVKIGVISEDEKHLPPIMDSAIYFLRLEIREYVEEIVGDDLSPAAQKIRSKARRM